MTTSFVRMLLAFMDSVFIGPNGDYPAILEATAGLNAEQARWKPAPDHNSVWMIVEHLTGSKRWLLDMLERGQASAPVWVEPTGGDAEWQTSLTHLKEAHERLKQAVERYTDEELFKVLDPKDGLTRLELILSGGPAHDAHHGGQIDYLKGLQQQRRS
jgi:uncharacterized damage-inducible protein DinB